MPDVTANLHETFDFTPLSTAGLEANDGVAGNWTLDNAASRLSTTTAAALPYTGTINGISYAATRGLSYNCSGTNDQAGSATYDIQGGSGLKNSLSFGFSFRFPAGMIGTFREHDLFWFNGLILGEKPIVKLQDNNACRLRAYTPNEGYASGVIALSPATQYWITGIYTKNLTDGFKFRAYTMAGVQVGSELTRNTQDDQIYAGMIGSGVGASDSWTGTLEFSSLILNYAATYPLGPPSGNPSDLNLRLDEPIIGQSSF